jgi:hypothetical protein
MRSSATCNETSNNQPEMTFQESDQSRIIHMHWPKNEDCVLLKDQPTRGKVDPSLRQGASLTVLMIDLDTNYLANSFAALFAHFSK